MSSLAWPGHDRGGDVDDTALLGALVAVEAAWLGALVAAGMAPVEAAADLAGLVGPADVALLADEAETSGTPVLPMVALLRARLHGPAPASAVWLHRGLTSQDVVDTAAMLLAGVALDAILADVRTQIATLAGLVEEHRGALAVTRTLTQYAVPGTLGLRYACWLAGVLDAADDLGRVRATLPVQMGGAAGTRAASAELAALAGLADPVAAADDLVHRFADLLGLAPAPPWHTHRRPVTRLADALVAATAAWGHLANDVLLAVRPEVGELSLSGPQGGSSTMPHKQNPVLPILVRRAALAAPALGAQLHLAAAEAVDERSDGAWHLEWAPLRTLLRTTRVAAAQTSQVVGSLVVHADRARGRALDAADDLLAERAGLRSAVGAQAGTDHDPAGYLGTADAQVTAVLARAARTLETLQTRETLR